MPAQDQRGKQAKPPLLILDTCFLMEIDRVDEFEWGLPETDLVILYPVLEELRGLSRERKDPVKANKAQRVLPDSRSTSHQKHSNRSASAEWTVKAVFPSSLDSERPGPRSGESGSFATCVCRTVHAGRTSAILCDRHP